jgi:membrane protease YdiL (CAAX protease family)
MRKDLSRVLMAAVPVIALLIAAAFIVPPTFPWLLRQGILTVIGVGGIALAEITLFRTAPSGLLARLGFVPANGGTTFRCLLVSIPMWAYLPVVAFASGAPVRVAPDALAILIGVILVNGIAEEVIHRAYVFGRMRAHATFLVAASIGAAVFALQHAYLIASLGVVGGLSSVVLALLLAYPMCRAFEDGGRSIAGPAILHTGTNASFMVFGDPNDGNLVLSHMAVVLVSVYLLFLFPRSHATAP